MNKNSKMFCSSVLVLFIYINKVIIISSLAFFCFPLIICVNISDMVWSVTKKKKKKERQLF